MNTKNILFRILFIIQILFVASWMALIFNFSSETSTASLKNSDDFLYKIVTIYKGHELTPKEKARIKKKYTYLIRKCAHFFLYFVLGIVVYILLSLIFKSPIKPVILAILLCFLYACSDEFHQVFVPGRTSQMFDIMVDTCGSMLSISLILLLRSFINLILCIYRKKA